MLTVRQWLRTRLMYLAQTRPGRNEVSRPRGSMCVRLPWVVGRARRVATEFVVMGELSR